VKASLAAKLPLARPDGDSLGSEDAFDGTKP
jgi:hypothetical protein